jgi:hypothetical protein
MDTKIQILNQSILKYQLIFHNDRGTNQEGLDASMYEEVL